MSLENAGQNRAESQENGNRGWLKQNSLDLNSVHLSGLGERADRLVNYEPGEWNEQNGIIMYSDAEGGLFAIPATDASREKIMSDPTFSKVEGKGVLNLGDSDMVWGGAEKNATNSAFNRWRELSLGAQNAQYAEVEGEKVIATAERDEFEEKIS